MSEENKNQDPEEEKNQNTNDDDFGLPDFEFEALDDDDIEEETTVPASSSDETPDPEVESVPSMDADDLEDLDLDGLDDLDVKDLDVDDLDDLGDLDLEDLDLDDVDLDDDVDIDTSEVSDQLADIDSAIEETSLPESGEENASTDDGFEMPTEELEDDGMFYEEETFDDFDDSGTFDEKQEVEDDGSSEEEISGIAEADESEFISEDADDSGLASGVIFDSDDDSEIDLSDDLSGLDLDEMEGDESEAVPFAQREVDQEYVGDFAGETSVPVEEVSDEEIGKAKGQFAKIVIFGVVLFVAIGAAFMFWSDSFDSGGGEDGKEVAQNEPKKGKEKKADHTKEKAAETKDDNTGSAEKEVKKTQSKESKPTSKTAPKKSVAKKSKPAVNKPKAKPAAVSSEGVTMYTAKVNRRHLIAGSFATEEKAKIYAQQLVAKGESPAVIPPFGSSGNYRVAITSFAKQSEALSNLDSYRENFGSTIWVLRY